MRRSLLVGMRAHRRALTLGSRAPRRARIAALALLSLAAVLLSLAQPALAKDGGVSKPQRAPARAPVADRDAPAPQNANDCAVARAEARYVGYGYTHVISVVNGCTKPVECSVWTDVDPDPKNAVSLRAGETSELVTRRGSPARDVTAFKQCSFR